MAFPSFAIKCPFPPLRLHVSKSLLLLKVCPIMNVYGKRSFETSSSIYPESVYENRHNDHVKTLVTPESDETHDDVYRPYITPPSPFQYSTQKKTGNASAEANPYAQSLWLTSRGNKGEEIEKYKELTTTTIRSDTKSRSGIITKECTSVPLNGLYKPSRDSNKENGSYLQFLLPNPIKRKSNLYRKISLRQKSGMAPTQESSIIELPHKFILIETRLTKIFKILNHLSVKFEIFVEDNGILCHPLLFSNIFGNVKTLRIIHDTFLQKLLDEVYPMEDLEDAIYDHLQRLSHVYPSYFQTMRARNIFVDALIKEHDQFADFFRTVQKYIDEHGLHNGITSFKEMVNAPALEIETFLTCIDDFMSLKSPRVEAIIEKLSSYIVHCHDDDSDNDNYQLKEPIYLCIPTHWKSRFKGSKEEKLEDQILRFFKHEFKIQYSEYRSCVEKIRNQVSQIANLSTTNIQIAKGFLNTTSHFKVNGNTLAKPQEPTTPKTKLFQDNMLQSMHCMYVDKIDIQNKAIYQLLYNFDQSLNVKNIEINDMCKFVLSSSKSLLKDTSLDRQYKTDQLYHYFHFQGLLKEATLELFTNYRFLFKDYIDVICSTNVYDPTMTADKLRTNWKSARNAQKIILLQYDDHLTENAIKSFVLRFFNN